MTIERRLENALRISKTIKDGKLDSKNLYDLQLHLSDALEQAEKLSIHSVLTRLDKLEIGDTYKYNPNDVGVFKILDKKDENWVTVVRTQSGRVTGSFPSTEVYPV